METTMSWVFAPRFKSFYWRTVMMGIAGALAYAAAHLVDLQLTGQAVVLVGLVLGELSKSMMDSLTMQS